MIHSGVQTLDAAGIPYAVAGGLAVSIYTVPRATKDIDVLMRVAISSAPTRLWPHSASSGPASQ